MSATINRSLTTIRTELEFLLESNVITQGLFDQITAGLPQKYAQGMAPADVTTTATANKSPSSVDQLSAGIQSLSTGKGEKKEKVMEKKNEKNEKIALSSAEEKNERIASSSAAPPPPYEEYCTALYDYKPQQQGDLELHNGDKIVILQKLSSSWWKGSCRGNTGVFPANYVKLLAGSAQNRTDEKQAIQNEEKVQQHQQSSFGYPAQHYQQPYQPLQQPYQDNPINGQMVPQQHQQQFYVNQQQMLPQQQEQQMQPQQQQEQRRKHGGINSFASRITDAAIFGAGATVGSNIVNSLF